jgi:hypothetical protein
MPKITIVPFRWYHIKALDIREAEQRHFETIPDYIERVKQQEVDGLGQTVIIEGEGPACSWGYKPQWPGVYECWFLSGYRIERYPITTIRQSRYQLDIDAISLQAHRLQMSVDASDVKALRYAKSLGFTSEGLMKAYGPDKRDYVRLARIFE